MATKDGRWSEDEKELLCSSYAAPGGSKNLKGIALTLGRSEQSVRNAMKRDWFRARLSDERRGAAVAGNPEEEEEEDKKNKREQRTAPSVKRRKKTNNDAEGDGRKRARDVGESAARASPVTAKKRDLDSPTSATGRGAGGDDDEEDVDVPAGLTEADVPIDAVEIAEQFEADIAVALDAKTPAASVSVETPIRSESGKSRYSIMRKSCDRNAAKNQSRREEILQSPRNLINTCFQGRGRTTRGYRSGEDSRLPVKFDDLEGRLNQTTNPDDRQGIIVEGIVGGLKERLLEGLTDEKQGKVHEMLRRLQHGKTPEQQAAALAANATINATTATSDLGLRCGSGASIGTGKSEFQFLAHYHLPDAPPLSVSEAIESQLGSAATPESRGVLQRVYDAAAANITTALNFLNPWMRRRRDGTTRYCASANTLAMMAMTLDGKDLERPKGIKFQEFLADAFAKVPDIADVQDAVPVWNYKEGTTLKKLFLIVHPQANPGNDSKG